MKTHFKKLMNPNFLGSWDLYDSEGNQAELTVTITKVDQTEVLGTDGRKDIVMTIHLKDLKPMIVNSTNAKMISEVLKTPFTEDWTNKQIILKVERVRAFGATHEAIRVKRQEVQAKAKETLTEDHAKWNAAKTALKAGNVTLESIQKKYTITEANIKKLQS